MNHYKERIPGPARGFFLTRFYIKCFFLEHFFPEHSLIAAHNRLKDPAPGRVLLICGLLSHKNGLPAELLLGIDQDLSPLVFLLLAAVRLQDMGLYIVLQLHFQNMDYLFP